jgi:hypothetical protein
MGAVTALAKGELSADKLSDRLIDAGVHLLPLHVTRSPSA